MLRIEGDYIREFAKICVNHNIAGRNKTDYKIDNIETITKYQKSYQTSYQPKYRLSHPNYQVKYKSTQKRIKILKIGYLSIITILLKYLKNGM